MSNWLSSISHAISKIIVHSVVDSLGKLLLLSLVILLLAAILVKVTWILIVLTCFPGLLLLMYIFSHFYCLIKNPDLLRSEEYNIKKQSIALIGDKDNYKMVDMHTIVDIANPYIGKKQIETKEDVNE